MATSIADASMLREQLAAYGALAAYTEQTGGRRATLWLPVQQQQNAEVLTENEYPAE
jgi:hypothetical protein